MYRGVRGDSLDKPSTPARNFSTDGSERLHSSGALEGGVDTETQFPDDGRQDDITSQVQQTLPSLPNVKVRRDGRADLTQSPVDT